MPSQPLELQLEHLLGFRPKHLPYYQLALSHRSQSETVAENNERLEYLGDAILGAIVADYLFKKYPTQPEGFMTEMRSRMVRRESLNSVAMQMGLNKLVLFNHSDRSLARSHIFGNALEALVGAVYLDVGYAKTRRFVLKQMIKAYMDMELIEATDNNHKNKLLSWAQRHGKKADFVTLSEKMEGARKVFCVSVQFDGEQIATGTGYTKKEASQAASQHALEQLGSENPES
ncbi:MAG: ribonuclease III [Bacteroidetes bacterium]|nr:ribonuclease III [Bacteroidota bacterium]